MGTKDKINRSLLVLVLSIIGLSSVISFRESNSKQLYSPGAESEKQLSNVLFHALRFNNFQQLSYYIPGRKEIMLLQAGSDEKNKLFFESMDEVDLKANIINGFDRIIREGIEKNINWAGVELVDYETKACNLNIDGCNVTYTIEDQNLNRIVITYDAIRIDNKWYLFQNLNLVDQTREMSRN